MLLALAICEICPSSDVDVIISVLMNLFDTRTSLVNLLKSMIDREIAHTGILTLSTSNADLILYYRE
jgi:neurofibromin 1